MLLQSFRKSVMPTFVLALVVSLVAQAQNSPVSPTPADPAPKESPITGVYTGKEIFVPNGSEEKEPEPPARSFADGFLRNTRQHMGFSLSVFELYTPDVRLSSGETKDVSFTSILPQLYLNFEKKKLDFRLTYGAAYRRFNNGVNDLNNRVSHNGTAEFSYSLLARQKTTLQLSSALTSEYYDAASSFLDWSSY